MAVKTERLYFFDNLRWFIIILVVLMHLNVTYSGAGLWYYKEPGQAGLEGILFGIYGSWTQAYFMGLLFFIAGFFVPHSFDKRGAGAFVMERLLRLGIPALVYMLVIHPITMFVTYGFSNSMPAAFWGWYADHIVSLNFLSTSGPLWFVIALFVFSAVYAAFKKIFPVNENIGNSKGRIHFKVIGLIAVTFLFAFGTRIFLPAGVPLFNEITGNFMQLGFFPSYISLFAAGILAFRSGLLSDIKYKSGRLWLILAFVLGVPMWFAVLIGTKVVVDPSRFPLLFGGFHLEQALYTFWESFFCVAVSTGLIVLFREKFNTQGRFAFFMKDNAFGVYVFHAPVLVAVTMAFKGLALNPVVKMYLMALIVIPVCFGFSALIRKVPVIKKYFT